MEKYKSLNEYKKIKSRENSYKEAVRLQEMMALSFKPQLQDNPAEGFMAVQDVLNKISAMNKMFDSCVNNKNGNNIKSSEKIIDIITDLYELAQIKLSEAKKQSESFLRKSAGLPDTDSSIEEPISDEPEESESEPEITRPDVTRSEKPIKPLSLPGDEEENDTCPVTGLERPRMGLQRPRMGL
ncbi:MAG: hypothetical protein ACOCV1_05360, partial [Bacillota bacterium]